MYGTDYMNFSRHRHRGLNVTINEISKMIPGSETAMNETKVKVGVTVILWHHVLT